MDWLFEAKKRFSLSVLNYIDLDCLVRLMGFTDLQDFKSAHKRWIEASLQGDEPERESHWTESIAVGSKSFTENVKKSLGFKAKGKSITGSKGHYQLREDVSNFGKTSTNGFEPAQGRMLKSSIPSSGMISLKRLIFLSKWAV